MTGEDVLDVLADAREEGAYVLITPDGQVFVGSIMAIAQVVPRIAMLEQLPTEGAPEQ